MKLRELFDRLTPGQLDGEVRLVIRVNAGSGMDEFRQEGNLETVRIEDDGSVTLTGVEPQSDVRAVV